MCLNHKFTNNLDFKSLNLYYINYFAESLIWTKHLNVPYCQHVRHVFYLFLFLFLRKNIVLNTLFLTCSALQSEKTKKQEVPGPSTRDGKMVHLL